MTRVLQAEDFRMLFAKRVERLDRLVKLRAPATVVAMEVILVLRGAFCLMPREVGDWLARDFIKFQRVSLGMCMSCDSDEILKDTNLCAMCRAEFGAMESSDYEPDREH